MFVFMRNILYICIHVYVCVCVCLSVSVYVCLCLHLVCIHVCLYMSMSHLYDLCANMASQLLVAAISRHDDSNLHAANAGIRLLNPSYAADDLTRLVLLSPRRL